MLVQSLQVGSGVIKFGNLNAGRALQRPERATQFLTVFASAKFLRKKLLYLG